LKGWCAASYAPSGVATSGHSATGVLGFTEMRDSKFFGGEGEFSTAKYLISVLYCLENTFVRCRFVCISGLWGSPSPHCGTLLLDPAGRLPFPKVSVPALYSKPRGVYPPNNHGAIPPTILTSSPPPFFCQLLPPQKLFDIVYAILCNLCLFSVNFVSCQSGIMTQNKKKNNIYIYIYKWS